MTFHRFLHCSIDRLAGLRADLFGRLFCGRSGGRSCRRCARSSDGAWRAGFRGALLVASAAALLSSCSGDPVQSVFERQALDWHACDPQKLDARFAPLAEGFGDRLRCAEMRVPLDYANPESGEASVALLRVAADAPEERLGAILFNFGGPGKDGYSPPMMFAARWGGADASTEVGRMYREMSRRYDLVGFSPRGVGASTLLSCSDGLDLAFVADPSRDRGAQNLRAILDNDRAIAESCLRNPLTRHVHSDAIARDMDLARRLLGDDKLNYIGFSYGTWLGNWYASLFPSRVGRMLLVGVTDFTSILNELFLPQEMGMQRVLDEVLIPYAARHPGRFGLGADPSGIRAMLAALPNDLHAATVGAMFENGISNMAAADTLVLTLGGAKAIAQALGEAIARGASLDESALTALVAGGGFVPREELRADAGALAADLVARYFRNVRREGDRMPVVGTDAAMWAVMCNDTGTPYTPESWITASNLNAGRYPDFGGFWKENACLYWGAPSVRRPSQAAAAQAGGILMLQSRFDPWTPRESAYRSLDVLPNASLIEVTTEFSHGLIVPYGAECIDRPVAEYFLTGRQPPRRAECAGRGLPADLDAVVSSGS